ncbi:hypothetical protein [Lysobacter gummosus]|uniref:hypothetical protein n=1 Tax=Lysobacter gummosus TaxID=262324 RepID=UPI00362D0119
MAYRAKVRKALPPDGRLWFDRRADAGLPCPRGRIDRRLCSLPRPRFSGSRRLSPVSTPPVARATRGCARSRGRRPWHRLGYRRATQGRGPASEAFTSLKGHRFE